MRMLRTDTCYPLSYSALQRMSMTLAESSISDKDTQDVTRTCHIEETTRYGELLYKFLPSNIILCARAGAELLTPAHEPFSRA